LKSWLLGTKPDGVALLKEKYRNAAWLLRAYSRFSGFMGLSRTFRSMTQLHPGVSAGPPTL
jgi:hypothetical protein